MAARPVLVVGGLLVCLALALQVQGKAPWRSIDTAAYDVMVRLEATAHGENRVIIVDIDEISLSTVGQWPWPRYHLAALAKAIAAAGPRALGLDILFAEEDRTSLATLREAFHREFGLDLNFSGIPPGLEDNDGYLGRVLAETRTVGATFFYFDLYNRVSDCRLAPLTVTGGRGALRPYEASGVMCNTPKIQSGLAAAGFINAMMDADGLMRRLPLMYAYDGQWYPSFALAVLMQISGERAIRIESDFLGPLVCVGAFRIPVDERGLAILRFTDTGRTRARISALDVLQQIVPPAALAGRIVIVGSTAAGLNDLHPTPVSADLPGADAFATLIESALDNRFYREPGWYEAYDLLTMLLAGCAVILAFVLIRPLRAMAVSFGVALSLLAGSVAVFLGSGVHLPFAGALTITTIQVIVLSIVVFRWEEKLAFTQLGKLAQVKQLTMESMAAVAENRQIEGDGHIKRTQHYVKILAEGLRAMGDYPTLTDDFIELLFHSAPLHDLGKVAIPDSILFKKGKLDSAEFEVMKRHAAYGKRIIDSASCHLEEDNFLLLAAEIAVSHHEKWDGSGYPHGLSAESIPLSGRIMALADVYDALVSRRVYKDIYSHETAREIIINGRGAHFDPAVVDCFLAREQDFIATSQLYHDADSACPTKPGSG